MPTVPPGSAMAATERRDVGVMVGHSVAPAARATISAAERHDSGSLAGTQSRAAMAAAERHDTSSIAGRTHVGSIAAVERHDTASIVGNTPNAILTVADARDVGVLAGSFATAASSAISERHDVGGLAAAFRGGSIAALERPDMGSAAAVHRSSGVISATERRDAAAMAGNAATTAALAAAEARDRGAIPAVAAGIPPYFKVQESGDVARILAGYTGVWYAIHGDTPGSGGPIDYDTIIDTTALTTWVSSPLAPGETRLAVRAENLAGIELNRDCMVRIVLDAAGNDVTNRPPAPVGVRAFARGPGAVVVQWWCPYNLGAGIPSSFNVYAGIGPVDYSTPRAVVPFSSGIANAFGCTLTGLTPGATYLVAVRAANRWGEGPDISTATAQVRSAGPSPPLSLAIRPA